MPAWLDLRRPAVRAWIYRGLLGTAPLAVAYEYLSGEEAALWIAAAGAWLGVGLAAMNTPTRHRDEQGTAQAAALLAWIVVVGVLALLLGLAAYLLAPTPADAHDVKPCRTEDQTTLCVWDHKHMGNGKGRSFIVQRDGDVVYVSHRRAHRHWAGC